MFCDNVFTCDLTENDKYQEFTTFVYAFVITYFCILYILLVVYYYYICNCVIVVIANVFFIFPEELACFLP